MKRVIFLLLLSVLVLVVGCTQEAMVDDTVMEEENSMADDKTSETDDTAMTDVVMVDDSTVYMDVNPAEAKELIDTKPDLIIIDVSPYYDDGHLPGAVGYYLGDGSLDEAIPSLDPNAEYLVYCHADGPSISGAQKLIDAGFKTVYRLEGNYAAWKSAGFPIE